MAFIEQNDGLWKEVSALAADEGLELYDLERFGNQGGLRVVVAKPETKNASRGISADDCAALCKRLITFFAVEGDRLGVPSEPQLDVSSPGINRVLRTTEHFTGAVGERVKLVWKEIESGHTETTVGVLKSFSEGSLTVDEEESGTEKKVLITNIRKARVDFPF